MGGQSESGGRGKELPFCSPPGLTQWRKSKRAVLYETWNHCIAHASRCWCQLHASFLHSPHLIPWDVQQVLLSPLLLSPAIATHAGLSYHHLLPGWLQQPPHWTPCISQRASFKTQVRSCHFSAQNPPGLPISFRIEAKVLTVVSKALWDLYPPPHLSAFIPITLTLTSPLQEHCFLMF